MKVLLSLAVLLALAAASAAYGTATGARIWLVTPSVVGGSGFPAGKVTVKAQAKVVVVRALHTGRFTARFDTPLKASGCRSVTVTALGAGGVRAVLKLSGNAKDCPPPIEP